MHNNDVSAFINLLETCPSFGIHDIEVEKISFNTYVNDEGKHRLEH
jgi:hypothetical protein